MASFPVGRDGEGLTVVVNPSAGPALKSAPTDVLREGLPKAEIVELDDPADLTEALEKAVSAGARALGVSGGDGSVNAAAGIAIREGLPLLVVPGGTLNHLAKALGLNSAGDSVDAVKSSGIKSIDVGLADSRLFLNTASIGAYVRLVDRREDLESRIGKWPAFVVAFFSVLFRSDAVDVEIDGERKKVWLIFFGNCQYTPQGVAPRERTDLADGLIDVRLLEARRGWSKFRLIRAALTGRMTRIKSYEERTTERVKIRLMAEEPRFSIDGETHDASKAFDVTKTPKALEVIVPKQDD